MVRLLSILSVIVLNGAIAAESAYSTIAEAFTAGSGQDFEIGYRVYTAPMLTEILARGMVVDRLEILPAEIRVEVGETFSLKQLRITAFGPNGNIQEHVPLSIGLEGSAEMLDFEEFIVYGDEIRAAQAGQAKIWITSIVPSWSGENVRQSISIVVNH